LLKYQVFTCIFFNCFNVFPIISRKNYQYQMFGVLHLSKANSFFTAGGNYSTIFIGVYHLNLCLVYNFVSFLFIIYIRMRQNYKLIYYYYTYSYI
jgi:hypothetical protein